MYHYSSGYQDAALLCLLWFLFGRASDLSHVRKQNLSVDATVVFFVRFIRIKTSEEQSLSLFPGADFITCPLHAIAVTLVTQSALSVAVLDNLPEKPVEAVVTLSPATPFVEVLNNPRCLFRQNI
uniref:Secreted protein n=1 Tax=Phytophthora ramorum TaxID=164328 RepID=H3GCG1_PHYRM